MVVLREFPRNPFILAYHLPIQLTRGVVEGYALGKACTAPPLGAEILRIPGVRGVQFFRYELWVRRAPDVTWQGLIPAIEAALRRHLEIDAVHQLSGDQRYMTFDVPHFDTARPQVFEGVETAASHPLARELFAVAGVAEVLFGPGQMRIRKGAAFRWEEMQPSIEAALKRFRWTEDANPSS